MLFNSIQYFFFFPIVVLLFFAIPAKLKNAFLLIVSYYFYMSWVPQYAILIIFSTVSTYLAAYLVEVTHEPFRKKAALGINIGINLLILGVFKYYDFFIEGIVAAITWLGVAIELPASTLLLPVGISFYTFQSLGYSIDVYRGRLAHEKSFLDYALFVSFFPQLVAGPIERATNLLPQFKHHASFEYDRVVSGLREILIGMFKKVVVADFISGYVNAVYKTPTEFGSLTVVVATLLFAMQVYCDFSGYSDIAVGSARVLGYELMENFKSPYFSSSIGEFWSRWHISLSTWFKDYLYIPLGGNRKGMPRRCFNLFLTFTISGLWHGANLTFIVWGMLHGLYRVVEVLLENFLGVGKPVSSKWLIPRIVGVNILVCVTWVFFRATSLTEAVTVFKIATSDWNFHRLWLDSNIIFQDRLGLTEEIVRRFMLFGCILFPSVLLLFEALRYRATGGFDSNTYIKTFSPTLRWIFYVLVTFWVLFIFTFENGIKGQTSQFIYFQF